MKKTFFALILIFLFPCTCHAVEISGEAGIVITADSNQVIYEKNSGSRLPMASTTKIMTTIVALEKASPDDIVTVSANAERQEGSSIYLRRGDKIRMEDLLYGLMLNSGNDAAVAVAEYVSGSVEEFSREMNDMAKRIGVKNSSFKNPNGLDHEKHYTTAYDLALITSYAMQNEAFKRIVSAREMSAKINNSEVLYFHNHNKLLKMYDGAVGVKTGFTKRSGRCLVSAAERNGVMLIAVTLNAPNDWNDHMNMLEYGFSRCKVKEIIKEKQLVKTLNTTTGMPIGALISKGAAVVSVDGKIPPCEIKLHMAQRLAPPIYSGEKIGEAEVILNGRPYQTTDILADRNVFESEERNITDDIMRVIKKWQNSYLQSL